jgi:CPA1 family monovalent cation:H+ antiporter
VEQIVLQFAGVLLLGITCQWLAWRAKLPAILFLLVAGIAVGPVLGWLRPDALLGDLLFPMVSLAVAVILFEGSLTLRFREIRGLERVVRRALTSGLLVTWGVTTVAAHWAVGFDWEVALLFGSLVVVTGPTVVAPMLRTVRPTARVAEVLRWEGIVIDPIGALLAVLVYDFLVARGGGAPVAHTAGVFLWILAVGIATGAATGQLVGMLLRSRRLPDYLRSATVLAAVCASFAGANALAHESGLLAVTIFGIWLANMRGVALDDILDFKETISLVLISLLFILLAARLRIVDLDALGWGAAWVFLAIQFVARPLNIAVSTFGSSLGWRERALLAWIAPRGIIAAAVSAIFAPRLAELGFAEAPLLVPLTMVVIIGTVLLQSATAGMLARALGVAEPEPDGVLIVGANRVARAIGLALRRAGVRVRLADTYWESVLGAREQGLTTYYGNPVAGLADPQLDLSGIGQLAALSPQHELNALAVTRYRAEFGRNAVFRLAGAGEPEPEDPADQDRILFAEGTTYADLAGRLRRGDEIRATVLDESLDWDGFIARHPDALPLFSIDEKARVHFFAAGEKPVRRSGTAVHALHPQDERIPRRDASTLGPGIRDMSVAP